MTPADLNEPTTRYDAAFRGVEGLTWLPWVGQRFPERPPHHRLLVVGESHYFIGTTPEERQANRDSYLKDPNSTREVASDALVKYEWTTKTLDTIPKLLFQTNEIDRSRLWGDTAYYNFVQRPLDKYQRERPTWDDFFNGWRVFSEVVRIIQPSHCLFIGVTAANSFNPWITSQNQFSGTVSSTQEISGTSARAGKLQLDGTTIELMFVKHLGMPIDCTKWNAHLQTQHADFMHWLTAESYPTKGNTT